MPWTPSYEVSIEAKDTDWKPTEEGGEFPVVPRDATWTGEADSPDEAKANALATWKAEYGDEPPEDFVYTVKLGPSVCPACKGVGWVSGQTYGLPDPGPDAPLGSTGLRECRPCLGTGNVTQKGPVRPRPASP